MSRLAFLALFAVNLLHLVSAAAVAGGATGDPELLSLVSAQNESNFSSISTCCGQSDVEDDLATSDVNGHLSIDHEVFSTASFWLDLDSNRNRRSWCVNKTLSQSAKRELTVVPNDDDNFDSMARPDGVYDVHRGFLPANSTVWQRTMVVWPLSHPNNMHSELGHFIDPLLFMSYHGHLVSDYLRKTRSIWTKFATSDGTIAVTRIDQRVELDTVGKGGAMNRLTFDLSKGGNLIEFKDEANGKTFHETIDYSKYDNIWVPSASRREIIGTDNVHEIRTVTFEKISINVTVPASEFQLEKLGVMPGMWITDRRVGIGYKFGDESSSASVMRSPVGTTTQSVATSDDLRLHANEPSSTVPNGSDNSIGPPSSDPVRKFPVLILLISTVLIAILLVIFKYVVIRRPDRRVP